MFKAAKLKVEYKTNPIGVDEPRVRFSYMLEGDSSFQSARQIAVRDENGTVAWDDCAQSADTAQIEYSGAPLKPFTRYFWSVRVWDEEGNPGPWSDGGDYFETGKMDLAWQAQWIASRWIPSRNHPASFHFCDFSVKRKIKKARIYSTAFGCYDTFINGKATDDDCLKPGWSDYGTRVQYQAYDVTDKIQEGENRLAATVAPGFFVSRGYGCRTYFSAFLRLEYEDGEIETISTGKDWKSLYNHVGMPIKSTTIFMGEIYDASEESAWMTPGFKSPYETGAIVANPDEAEYGLLKQASIVWQSGAPVRRMHKLLPKSIEKRPNGTYIVDFGQNFAGREEITLRNTQKGSTIVIKHGEVLESDGSLYTVNLRSAQQCTVYTTGTNALERHEPLYTFYGFRYLEISGWPGELRKEDICAYAIYSDCEGMSDFECSDPLVNRLFQNIIWGQRSNFVDIPTDCPQRDERMGWTGDIQVFMNTAVYNMSIGAFMTKWLDDLNSCADRAGGRYPNVAPSQDISGGAAGWADAGIVCPKVMAEKYGDLRILRRHFGTMFNWQKYREANAKPHVALFTFGDWLNQNAETDRDFISTAYHHKMSVELARLARIIGKEAEAAELDKMAARAKETIHKTWFLKDGTLSIKTQTAALMAIGFNLCPDEKSKKAISDFLVDDIVNVRQTHLSTGFLGTPLLLNVLSEIGRDDVAYGLLLQKEFPGWLYQVEKGATTMWERWNSINPDGTFADAEMNSFNHYAYGAVAEWFFEKILGIELDASDAKNFAYRKFNLSPRFGTRLESAKGSIETPCGKISSSWHRSGNGIGWEFSVPPNSVASVVVPAGYAMEQASGLKMVSCGKYEASRGDYSVFLRKV